MGSRCRNIHEEWKGALCISVNEINRMVSDNIREVVLNVVVTVLLCFAIVGDCIVVVLTVCGMGDKYAKKGNTHVRRILVNISSKAPCGP